MGRLALVVLGWLVLWMNVQGASFDCAKALSKVEHLICDNPEISRQDDELAQVYKIALQDKAQADVAKQAQKQWLKYRNSCADASCVNKSYEKRIKVLRDQESISETYSLVMSKDNDLCGHMLKIFNEDLIQHGKYGSNYHDRHMEFTQIPWEKARYSVEIAGGLRYVDEDVKSAVFDFNNDGIKELVIHEESMLSGMRADGVYMLDSKDAKVLNNLTLSRINGSQNNIRIAGDAYKLTEPPLDGQSEGLWLLSPLKYHNIYYLFMHPVAIGTLSRVMVVAKYHSGKFVLGEMTGNMEDICYYKYKGAMRDVSPHQ